MKLSAPLLLLSLLTAVGSGSAAAQGPLEGLQVERLAVGDDAVEIEDHRLQSAHHAVGSFSPAVTAILSRFEGGG